MKWLFVLLALVLGFLPLKIVALGSPGDTLGWTNPTQMALKNVIPAHLPNRFHTAQTENFDCQDESGGCFIRMAYGEEDTESNTAIFAGTSDRTLPITPFIGGQVLIGWPATDTVLALTTIPTGGVQIGLYRFFTGVLADQTDALGTLTGKRVTRTADLILASASGQPLLFNPNTLAFSDHGSWLVGETLNNGFVRINLATLGILSFAPAFTTLGNAPGLNESQLSITDDGKFVAVANRTAASVRVYDLSNCTGSNCASFNYWSFLAGQLPANFVPVHLRFLNDGLLSFHGNSGLLEASYLLAPTDHIDSLLSYLGLGDSYAAGEGAEQYRQGTDVSSNMCHLSDNSYPLLITRALFTSVAGNSVACSGAKSTDVVPLDASVLRDLSEGATSRILTSFSPGSLPQEAFVSTYQPKQMTLEIGGNDIGFRDVLVQCVMLHIGGKSSCYNSYEDRLELANLIDQTMPKLTRLYLDIKNVMPLGSVYVVGYPEIVIPGNCADNVHLDASEIRLAGFLTHHLNIAIAEAARQAGATYIDVSQAFAGHRLCETNSAAIAVNGLTAGGDSGVKLPRALWNTNLTFLSNGSYHPNIYGQQLLEQIIKAKLKAAPEPVTAAYSPAATDTSGLLAAPKTNRPITRLSFANLGPQNITGHAQMPINLRGMDVGLRPNTDYTVRLDGSGGTVLGVVHTDSEAVVSGNVIAPTASDTPEVHTIDLVGPNQAGEISDIRQVITVSPPETTPTEVTTLTSTADPPASTSLQQKPLLAAALTEPGQSEPTQDVFGLTAVSPQSGSGSPRQLLAKTTSGQPVPRPWPKLPVISWLVYLYALLLLWVFYVAGRLSTNWRQFI